MALGTPVSTQMIWLENRLSTLEEELYQKETILKELFDQCKTYIESADISMVETMTKLRDAGIHSMALTEAQANNFNDYEKLKSKIKEIESKGGCSK